MGDRPSADWEVSAAQVEALVATQCAHLTGPVCFLAEGWDNVLFRVGKSYVARLPRREVAVALVENEHRWLPRLPTLPIATSIPVHCGAPTAEFPYPWSLNRYLPGQTVTRAGWSADEREARRLGEFCAALHVPAPAEAPSNPFRGQPLRSRSARLFEYLAALPADQAEAIRAVWSPLAALAPGPRTWLHGDLHPRNVLVFEDAISAVIDFGDVCAGDRASDLAVGFMLFEEVRRASFFEAAGASEETVERARGWAIALGTVFLLTSDADPAFNAMARDTLQRATGHSFAARRT